MSSSIYGKPDARQRENPAFYVFGRVASFWNKYRRRQRERASGCRETRDKHLLSPSSPTLIVSVGERTSTYNKLFCVKHRVLPLYSLSLSLPKQKIDVESIVLLRSLSTLLIHSAPAGQSTTTAHHCFSPAGCAARARVPAASEHAFVSYLVCSLCSSLVADLPYSGVSFHPHCHSRGSGPPFCPQIYTTPLSWSCASRLKVAVSGICARGRGIQGHGALADGTYLLKSVLNPLFKQATGHAASLSPPPGPLIPLCAYT